MQTVSHPLDEARFFNFSRRSFKIQAIEEMGNGDSEQDVLSDDHKQWVADNVDHNVATLTGKRTFHCMRIIFAHTKPMRGFRKIPHLKERQPAAFFTNNCEGEMVLY